MKQLIIPSITIFKADESIDFDATQEHVDWLIREGADTVVLGGSSGEFPSLSHVESTTLFKLAVQASSGRVPIYGAVCKYSTRDAIELTKAAENLGVDGVMVIVPYYMKPDQASIKAHFRAVRSSTNLPIILYNNPATVGVELGYDAIIELLDDGTVQGVKSSQLGTEASRLANDRPGMKSYYGHDFNPTQSLSEGAHGWFSLFPNVAPASCSRLVKSFDGTDAGKDSADKIGLSMSDLVSYVWGGPAHPLAMVKACLHILGRKAGFPRLPLLPAPEYAYDRLESLLEKVL